MYEQLSFYTLSRGDPEFIYQHIVDAYAAEHSAANPKPITTAFALIGLYVAVEKRFTGKEVQRTHMYVARARKAWPHFGSPQAQPDFTVFDVMRAEPGDDRDQAIIRWCASVWKTWSKHHREIAELAERELEGWHDRSNRPRRLLDA